MIKGEWDYIRHNRLILISVLAIMFIPFLYCIFFLKSVWDPYGETGELPVAVVNQDKPVTYQGQKLNVGDQTVTNLKKNKQLGWKFVSAKTAADGLKHHKYYTVITLPKNFSSNAATALNKHPKKMTFTYKTNGSANYIAQVMSEVGSSKLDSQIRAKVTKAYAQATFKQIYTVGQGMNKAAKGSAQLKDGTVTLTDGLNTYTTGVKTLNNGLQQMKTSVTPLATGIQQLSTGSATLASGLSQYTAGVSKLNSNMPTLQAGAAKLNRGTYTYVDGVYKLNSGLGQMSSKVGPLASGVTQLKTGSNSLTKGLKKLDSNSSQLTSGSATLASALNSLPGMLSGLQSSAASLSGLTPSTLSDMSKLLDAMPELSDDEKTALQTALPQLAALPTFANTLGAQAQDVQAKIVALSQTTPPANTGTDNSATVESANNAAQAADDAADKLQAAIAASADSSTISTDASNVKEATQASKAATKAVSANKVASTDTDTSDYATKLKELTDSFTTLAGSLKQMQTLAAVAPILTKVEPAMNGMLAVSPAEIQALQTAMPGLQGALQALNGLSGASTQLDKLLAGANQLNDGVTQYTAGVHTALDGSQQVTTGLNTLNSNIPALTSGASQLLDGSNTLAKKGSELTSGTSSLNSGIGQVASGVSQLNGNSAKLNSGAGQLSSGLSTLNGKIPTLTSGVNQLADGSAKLDANSNKLMQGTNKLSKGSGTLAKSLKSGADQINAQPLTSKTADMFAAPTHLKHESYSYVPNYGHALAPYVLSVALYVGALVFNFAFPIRKVSMAGGSASGWFLSKLSIGAVEGLAMGVIEPSLMMLAGLSVDHPMQMILISVLFAEASMFIVMFLSMLLDNPGRFIAMVLLMLQLGGSGGTFPMEVTNHFYNVVHPFLPMTYSILGFREAITSGMSGMVGLATWVLLLFTVIAIALLWPTMWWLQKKHLMGVSQLDDNQKLQEVEDPNTNSHS
ncbi:YhgE/Pip domain-containing protein [Levilactobacillus lindianensis]|uniref:YhgE/Pip domain-containing protein n=1 Tax=Levilactobacillus lindianensis TaxID=2486018 RepID=UPI000F739580|nr:YhgE/Pip domain-containing protein [Levilactobacillus lindianensis]